MKLAKTLNTLISRSIRIGSVLCVAAILTGCHHTEEYYKANPQAAHIKMNQCETLAYQAIHSNDSTALDRLAASSECRAALSASNTHFRLS